MDRIAAPDVWSNDGDLVFSDEFGGLVHPNRLSQSLDRIVRDAELPRIGPTISVTATQRSP